MHVPSSQGVGASVMKNCEPLVLGPALACFPQSVQACDGSGVGRREAGESSGPPGQISCAQDRRGEGKGTYHGDNASATVLQVARDFVLKFAPVRGQWKKYNVTGRRKNETHTDTKGEASSPTC